MKYRGYYVDGVQFSTKAEIDEFILQQTLESYRDMVIKFSNDCSPEIAVMCEGLADKLHKLGLTWPEIEAVETDTLKESV